MEKTTLIDFCDFLEKELSISLTTEKWKIYRQQKIASLENERAEIQAAHLAGNNSAELDGETETEIDYYNNHFGELS